MTLGHPCISIMCRERSQLSQVIGIRRDGAKVRPQLFVEDSVFLRHFKTEVPLSLVTTGDGRVTQLLDFIYERSPCLWRAVTVGAQLTAASIQGHP